MNKEDEKRSWPVFLIGCHRSGTTLLRFLLDSHENLACPPESKFVAGIEALIDYPQALEALRSLGYSRNKVYAELRKLIDSFLGGYAKRHGKLRWIDKTPNYYRLLPLLDELFDSQVLYLFLVRHPLDCVGSLESTFRESSQHPDPELARTVQLHGRGRLAWARYWNDVNEHLLVFSHQHADRCHTVRYEDLARRTDPTLRRICEFLREPFTDQMVRSAFAQSHTEGFADPKILKTHSVVSDRIGRWRNWSPGEAAALWRTVQTSAQEFGYSLASDEGVPVVDALLPEASAASVFSGRPEDAPGSDDRLLQLVNQCVPPEVPILIAGQREGQPAALGSHPCSYFAENALDPGGSASLIVQLEFLRANGARILVIPESAVEWLTRHAALKQHLENRYGILSNESSGMIFALAGKDAERPSSTWQRLESLVEECEDLLDRPPVILDCQTDLDLSAAFPNHTVFRPLAIDATLPYLDDSVDIVIARPAGKDWLADARLADARRVAKLAVAFVGSSGTELQVEWKSARQSSLPATSIVVSGHKGADLSEARLLTLQETLPANFHGEIILILTASTDGTSARAGEWSRLDPRIKVLQSDTNLGIAEIRNLGAHAATGDFLVFLNNDVVPLAGWLPPLLRTLRSNPQAGAVGGKLVYPRGTLSQAGGVVLDAGLAASHGNGDSEIEAPRYQHVREVDYCSASLLATPTSIFREVGGFHEPDAAGIDYCFRVREQGYGVYCQPESVAIDRENNTANVEGKPQPGVTLALAGRGSAGGANQRVLVGAYVPPEFDRSSGSRRILDLIEFLVEDGWSVTFLAHSPLRQHRYVRVLQQRGVAVYDRTTPAEELFAAGAFDLALFAFWPVAEAFLPAMRSASPDTRILVDSLDLHFLRASRGVFSQSAPGKSPLLGSGFGSEMIREVNVYAAADAVLTVSQKEANLINDLTADPKLAYAVADCEDGERLPQSLHQRQGIVFVGFFQHEPNAGAVEYLCREILPKVDPALLARHPVRIVGDGLTEQIRAFGEGLENVHMVGWVPSVTPYLEAARISVVPLLYGAGTKRKVLQSLLAGTPVVSTSIGVEGLDLRHEEHVLVADEADSFARSIERLLSDDVLWQRLAHHGANQLRQTHGRATVRSRFREVLREVGSRAPKAARRESAEPGPVVQKCFTADQYRALAGRFQKAVCRQVPPASTVLVISKGDDTLLQLNGCRAWHFPQNGEGLYAGHYPADSAGAIKGLENLRAQGAEYLVLPETAFWWLDHYDALRLHLDTQYERTWVDRDCMIYRLASREEG